MCADDRDFSDHANYGNLYDIDHTDYGSSPSTLMLDGATSFKGSQDSYFGVPADAVFDTQYHLTILLHVYATSAGDLLHFVGGDVRLSLVDNSGNLDLEFTVEPRDGVAANGVVAVGNFPVDTWTYVAATYDYNTGSATLYKDGSLSDTLPTALSSSSEINTIGDLAVGKNFTGSIHCVRLFDRVFGGSEITAAAECPLGRCENWLISMDKLNINS